MYPRLFTIGPFSLPTYGALVALAFLLGLHLAGKLARRSGLPADHVTNMGVHIALAAILGAKLFLILSHADYYFADPKRLFTVEALQAGGVFYGGLLAALGVAYYYVKRHGLPWLRTADVFAPAAAAGHAVGRLGCFAAGCCWGRPTDEPWGVVFSDPRAHEFTGVPLGVHLHPTQLYESFGTALVALFLYRRFLRPHADGVILGWYLILYSSFRFVVEFFRDDAARPMVLGSDTLSATQWVAMGLIVAGCALLLRNRHRAPAPAAAQPR
ncbi:MAG: prolipoprotein diacylglyceryl transferase [Acidobacteria bacterium]|nr:prolipoprotein diacylglyceryl transferase [Acidobacteriota bacterium]